MANAMATKSIGLLAALAPAMAIRQLMSDVRPDEEAALRALVQPVEPIQQPQEGAVLGYWPMQQLIVPGGPMCGEFRHLLTKTTS